MSTPEANRKYELVLLKLSGEAFGGSSGAGINSQYMMAFAEQIHRAVQTGVRLAIVVGGGNLVRGSQFSAANSFVQESTAHYMGMLGTVINGLALQDSLEHIGCKTRLMSAIRMDVVCEPFIRRRASRHLEKGRVVILAGGTGNPFVTTDTCASLRACELGADVLLKATRVDGVFSADPEKNPHAVLYPRLTYQKILEQNLKVMDMTAIGQCMDNKVPILVFNYTKPGNIERAVAGELVGTYIDVEK